MYACVYIYNRRYFSCYSIASIIRVIYTLIRIQLNQLETHAKRGLSSHYIAKGD